MANGAAKTCSVEGCERSGRIIRGWCFSHYCWARNNGWKQPTHQIVTQSEPYDGAECSVKGCDNTASTRGWCKTHYGWSYAHDFEEPSHDIGTIYGPRGGFKGDLRLDQMTEAQIAWCAGLFEGEGSCGITSERGYPWATLAMTDRDVVEKFVEYVGGRVNGPHGNGRYRNGTKCKPMFQASYNGEQAIGVMSLFRPYFGERRRAQVDSMTPQEEGSHG